MIEFITAIVLIPSAFADSTGGAATPAAGQQTTQGFSIFGMLPLLLILVVMYFMMIRPQQRKQKTHQAMIGAVKPGDEVVTSGGVYGVVAGVDEKENTIWLKVANDVKIKIERFSIARKLEKGDEPDTDLTIMKTSKRLLKP